MNLVRAVLGLQTVCACGQEHPVCGAWHLARSLQPGVRLPALPVAGGQQPGDFVLYVQVPQRPDCFASARTLTDTAPLRLAAQLGGRVLLYSDARHCYFPVMP